MDGRTSLKPLLDKLVPQQQTSNGNLSLLSFVKAKILLTLGIQEFNNKI